MRDYTPPEPGDPSILLPMNVYLELVAERDEWKARVRQMEAQREIAEDFHSRMRLLTQARRAAAVLYECWERALNWAGESGQLQLDCEGYIHDANKVVEECPWIKNHPTIDVP